MAKREKARPKKTASAASRVRKNTQKRQQTKAEARVEARQQTKLPNSFKLTWQVVGVIRRFWRPLGGILLVYLTLIFLLASGLSNLNSTIDNVRSDFNAGTDRLSASLNGFYGFLGSPGNSNGWLQVFFIILISLVIIWALRQLMAGKTVGVKEAYYQSMSPLIPFLIVMFVIFIQLLPLTLGTAILSVVLTSIFTSGAVATTVFSILFAGLAAWSIYMLSSSIFALYIVTLPDMQPRQALRSAKNLVHFRRWTIMRRLIFLPLIILVILGIIIVPLILWLTAVAPAAFFILSALAILFAHTYLYSLYRSLL